MTNKEKQQLQDGRIFATLCFEGPATAEAIADNSGDSENNIFCTPAAASAALRRFEKMGLAEAADPPDGKRRRNLKYWQPTYLADAIADSIIAKEGS